MKFRQDLEYIPISRPIIFSSTDRYTTSKIIVERILGNWYRRSNTTSFVGNLPNKFHSRFGILIDDDKILLLICKHYKTEETILLKRRSFTKENYSIVFKAYEKYLIPIFSEHEIKIGIVDSFYDMIIHPVIEGKTILEKRAKSNELFIEFLTTKYRVDFSKEKPLVNENDGKGIKKQIEELGENDDFFTLNEITIDALNETVNIILQNTSTTNADVDFEEIDPL